VPTRFRTIPYHELQARSASLTVKSMYTIGTANMLTWYAAESSDIPQHTTFNFPLISKTFYAHTFRMSAKFAKACNAVKISGTLQHLLQHWVKILLVVVVRPSGNGVGTINKVTLCQLLSVPRWVTFRGVPPQHATTNSGELSYLPLAGGEMRSGQEALLWLAR